MNSFTEVVEKREVGARLLEDSSNLYRLANEAKSMSDMLELTLQALNKDLEALSIIWEATVTDKEAIEQLKSYWEKDIRTFENEIFDVHP